MSSLLLGAHFYRADLTSLAVFVAISPLILLFRRLWSVCAVQLILLAGAIEWARTLVAIASLRQAEGLPGFEWLSSLVPLLCSPSFLQFRMDGEALGFPCSAEV